MMAWSRPVLLVCVLALAALASHAGAETSAESCGERITLRTHDGSTTAYALARPRKEDARGDAIALVLLPGGSGVVDLDASGCARALKGNWLVRANSLFRAEGFVTALVDAPSDWQGADGLAGFRIDRRHAEDLGRVIEDVRVRTGARVWLVGTSRGAISAANAATRLKGAAAPDGVVLASPVSKGQANARKAFAAQSVFDLPLEMLRRPILVVGHADDTCARSPPDRLRAILDRTEGAREQSVVVTGGPGGSGLSALGACEGRAPHGFIDQEAEVVRGIARFVRGGTY